MGLWQRLTAQFRPPTLEHPVFGHMTFMAIKPPRVSYWEGSAIFRPTGSQIEVSVDGDQNGPIESSLAAWHLIQERYPSVWPEIEAVLMRAYADWFQGASTQSGSGRFILGSMSVPPIIDSTAEWELTYDCRDDPEHIFTLRMRGWSPQPEVSIDG